MPLPELTLTTEPDDEGGKTRSFTVLQIAHLLPDDDDTHDGVHRPWLLAGAASRHAVEAFTTNLRRGTEASLAPPHTLTYKLPSTYPYRFRVTTSAAGALLLAYLPELFHLDPGAPESSRLVRFVNAPSWDWLDNQVARLEPKFGEDARDYARAASFVARLDRRTPLPIANRPHFHLGLYRRALEEAWTLDPYDGLDEVGFDRLGLDDPVACVVSADELESFLADTTAALLPRQRVTDRPPPPAPALIPALQPATLAPAPPPPVPPPRGPRPLAVPTDPFPQPDFTTNEQLGLF